MVVAGAGGFISQCAGEGLVQERLLQRLQRGVLPLVEAGEALGFFAEVVELGRDGLLFFQGPQWNGEQLHRHAGPVGTPCAVRRG